MGTAHLIIMLCAIAKAGLAHCIKFILNTTTWSREDIVKKHLFDIESGAVPWGQPT